MYEEDFGKYTCEAGNKYGKDTQHLELYESSIPICPPLCGDTDLNSSAAATDMGKISHIYHRNCRFCSFPKIDDDLETPKMQLHFKTDFH